MAFTLSDEDLKDPEILGEKLIGLSGIVYSRHYYASVREKEDLISVGVVKALSLISAGRWDGQRNLINYLYTGIRNEMHNYLYKVNKEVCFDEFYEDSKEDIYFENECLKISDKVIEDVCSKFSFYGDMRGLVINKMSDMGFVINKPKVGYKVVGNYTAEFIEDLVERVVGAVVWKSQECYH